MSTQAQEETTYTTQEPAGFDFNYRAYAECGVVSWRGPTASTSDESLNILFEWDPAAGTVATLDGFDGGEYTVTQMRELHAALGSALASLEPDDGGQCIPMLDLGAALVSLEDLGGTMQTLGHITPEIWNAAIAAGQAWKAQAGK